MMDNRRTYRNDEITVYWNPTLCCHSTVCLRALPRVFNSARTPWIDLTAEESRRIMEVIDRCPSRALSYSIHEK